MSKWLEWMPAHTTKGAIGKAKKSSGRTITAVDHRANFLADGLAKKAAELHRVALYCRNMFDQAQTAINFAAAMVGVTGYAANNLKLEATRADGTTYSVVKRDSAPMTWDLRKAERLKAKEAAEKKKAELAARVEATKATRVRELAEEQQRTSEDRRRRQQLAALLTESASELHWDWTLTQPAKRTELEEGNLEHLFEAAACSTEEDQWDWTLTQPASREETAKGEALEHLFEATAPAAVEQPLVMRSQGGLTAGLGASSFPRPVGVQPDAPITRARTDGYRPSVQSRGEPEAQVPGSSRTLSAQQLNSKKQNARRAGLRAAERKETPAFVTEKTTTTRSAARGSGEEPTRLLSTVAAFWARKKARLEEQGAERGAALQGEV